MNATCKLESARPIDTISFLLADGHQATEMYVYSMKPTSRTIDMSVDS
jgi:hypothetical protein